MTTTAVIIIIMKISFYTLGCKLNQAETEELKIDLLDRGFSVVNFCTNEDITIIRGCGVTCNASQSTREMIRKAKRNNTHVIICGCTENKELSEIDFIGKNNKEIIKYISTNFADGLQNDNNLKITGQRTRTFIKIQTGCNFQCAYCIIPTFRGKSNSISTKNIIEKIKQESKKDCQEIVLTGVNICQYNDNNLAKLIKLILKETSIPRIRLGSLDPRLINKELINLYSNDSTGRLMPHWHLSLQSGSNDVLKAMNRYYTTKEYTDIVNKVRKRNKLFSFTTDIIVGFPGETDDDFKKTCKLVEQVGFSKVHVFPFSPRPNTKASNLKPIHNQTVTKRSKMLAEIVNKVAKNYNKKLIGLKKMVLLEYKKNNNWFGYTPEYVRIKYPSRLNLENKIKTIKIKPGYLI
jgi:threonylcarbamoyladenosine tRNA methylthiotransferase MtaB